MKIPKPGAKPASFSVGYVIFGTIAGDGCLGSVMKLVGSYTYMAAWRMAGECRKTHPSMVWLVVDNNHAPEDPKRRVNA